MKYNSSLGTTARIITAMATVLFATIAVFAIKGTWGADKGVIAMAQSIFMILLLLAIYVFCYLYRSLGYFVDRESITIYRPIKNVKIPLDEVMEVFQATPESMKWSMRTFGNGGLFGFYGKFWNKKYGNMTWYATRKDNLIVIVTREGKKIVLTPDQISMLDEIQRRLMPRDMQHEV